MTFRFRPPLALRRVVALAGLVAATTFVGCADPNRVAKSAPRVPISELGKSGPVTVPFVVHFKIGDRVPVDLAIESAYFDLVVPELTFIAKREFFVLFRADGMPLFSEDGVDFTSKGKNSFLLGFKVGKDEPPRIETRLGIRKEE